MDAQPGHRTKAACPEKEVSYWSGPALSDEAGLTGRSEASVPAEVKGDQIHGVLTGECWSEAVRPPSRPTKDALKKEFPVRPGRRRPVALVRFGTGQFRGTTTRAGERPTLLSSTVNGGESWGGGS